jgi:sugar phosphate isomerase/epimerase
MLPSHGGRAKLDILLEVAPSLTWQPDVGNFYLAGMTDTLQTLEAYRDRISSLHVKDIRSDYKERTHPCSALATGDGVVPLAPALVFCQQELGITDFIIEQEGFANNEGCDDMMTRSLAYLKEVLGSD